MAEERRLAAGRAHACYLTTGGDVMCWGSNDDAQAGVEVSAPIVGVPVKVDLGAGHTAKRIAAGSVTTCAVRDDDAVWCWGDNTNGAAGHSAGQGIDPPGPVDGELQAKQISVGDDFACAVTLADQVMCWGLATYYETGTGNTGNSSTPAFTNPQISSATALGTCPNCATTCAISAGKVLCWGGDVPKPSEIPGVDDAKSVTVISAGSQGGAGELPVIVRSDGSVVITRPNGSGGYEAPMAYVDAAVGQVVGGQNFCTIPPGGGKLSCTDSITTTAQIPPVPSELPAAEQPPDKVVEVAAGISFLCARSVDAANHTHVTCRGRNEFGQLGDDTASNVITPRKVATPIAKMWRGGDCTTALGTDGQFYAFGACSVYGGNTAYVKPAAVQTFGPAADLIATGPAVGGAVGEDHRGLMMVNGHLRRYVDGTLASGGFNDVVYRQFVLTPNWDAALDSDTLWLMPLTTQANADYLFGSAPPTINTPKSISPAKFIAFAAAPWAGHICAWDTSYMPTCFGRNDKHQASVSMSGSIPAPSTTALSPPFSGASKVASMAVGADHACLLEQSTGDVQCWGGNAYGELGVTGTGVGPNKVNLNGDHADMIAAAAHTTCAHRSASNDIWCWGECDHGECGRGILSSAVSPASVQGLPMGTAVTTLAPTHGAFCALLVTNEVYCWGEGRDGQTGTGAVFARLDFKDVALSQP